MSREDVTAAGTVRRALSGLAPPASTVLRIPLRGTRLRRAVDPGDLCPSSGPNGEGQARGQARSARGKPPQAHQGNMRMYVPRTPDMEWKLV
jgi:hypothetical protein